MASLALASRAAVAPTPASRGVRSGRRGPALRRCMGAPGRRLAVRPQAVQSEVELDPALAEQLRLLRAENLKLRSHLAAIQARREGVSEAEAVARVSEVAGLSEAEVMSKLEAGIVWPKAGEGTPFWDRAPRTMELAVGGSYKPPAPKDGNPLHVVHIAAELAPFAKVGGLGDVVTGLAKACEERGHYVEVILPYYTCIPEEVIQNKKHEAEFSVPKYYHWDGEMRLGHQVTHVYSGRIAGVNLLLLQPDHATSNFFVCDRIYGGSYNEIEAYLYFCRAALEFLSVTGRQPSVLHLHEWQASATALLYWEIYHRAGLPKPRLMLTIHSMANSGEVRQDEFMATGVHGEMFATIEKALDERTIGHNPERLNMLKGAINYSNWVTTVSPSYADEAVNGGAAGWLREHFNTPAVRNKFSGVLNGIDTEEWDPTTDSMLPATFSAELPGGKALCKRYLQQGLGLTVDPSKPLVACVSRLVPQKGIHLIKRAIYRTAEQGGQFVLLGSGHADGDFRHMAATDFADHPDVSLKITYSERLAHLIYAAADIVVVPSMFEPCGLTQLIAIRYGALPLVRRTGGLGDTVFDVDADAERGNGFVFDGADEAELDGALDRALAYYTDKPEWWAKQSAKNLREDCGWQSSAADYVSLYRAIAC